MGAFPGDASSRAGSDSRFPSVTWSTEAKLTLVQPQSQRRLGQGPGPELTEPTTGSLSKFQVSSKEGENPALRSLISSDVCTG